MRDKATQRLALNCTALIVTIITLRINDAKPLHASDTSGGLVVTWATFGGDVGFSVTGAMEENASLKPNVILFFYNKENKQTNTPHISVAFPLVCSHNSGLSSTSVRFAFLHK